MILYKLLTTEVQEHDHTPCSHASLHTHLPLSLLTVSIPPPPNPFLSLSGWSVVSTASSQQVGIKYYKQICEEPSEEEDTHNNNTTYNNTQENMILIRVLYNIL